MGRCRTRAMEMDDGSWFLTWCCCCSLSFRWGPQASVPHGPQPPVAVETVSHYVSSPISLD
jgi:hypothetical protein